MASQQIPNYNSFMSFRLNMMYSYSDAETQFSQSNMVYRIKEGGPVSYEYQEQVQKKDSDKQNYLDGYQNINNSLVITNQSHSKADPWKKRDYKKLIKYLLVKCKSSGIGRKVAKNQSKTICLQIMENVLQGITIGQWKSEKHVTSILEKLSYFIKNALVEKQTLLEPHFFSKYLEIDSCSSKNIAKRKKSSLILKSDHSIRNNDKEYQQKIRQVQLLFEVIKGNYQEIKQSINEVRRCKRLNHQKFSILCDAIDASL